MRKSAKFLMYTFATKVHVSPMASGFIIPQVLRAHAGAEVKRGVFSPHGVGPFKCFNMNICRAWRGVMRKSAKFLMYTFCQICTILQNSCKIAEFLRVVG